MPRADNGGKRVAGARGRCQYPDFTSAFRDMTDMAGAVAGLVPVANDPKAASCGLRVKDARHGERFAWRFLHSRPGRFDNKHRRLRKRRARDSFRACRDVGRWHGGNSIGGHHEAIRQTSSACHGLRHAGTAPHGRRAAGLRDPSDPHHAGQGRDAHRHASSSRTARRARKPPPRFTTPWTSPAALTRSSTATAAHPRMRSVRAFSASAQRTIRSPFTPS